jgi:hypothetical protein
MADLDSIFKALRLLPEFDGNPNVLTRFIKLCDQLVDEFVRPDQALANYALINGILNKVTGPAARLINANGVPESWAGIRNALINNFADQRDETSLYNDLALLSQGNTTPQEFYEKCQNLFSTLMTYIDSKRDLYKKLTLQAYVRGLKDPLGSRIRCMRPETIEKALEFVHEEINTLYLQQRNDRLDKKPADFQPSKISIGPMPPGFAVPPFRQPAFNLPGPSRPNPVFLPQQSRPIWRPNLNQPPQGPTRTQQIFGARPPNYNPQENSFRPRNHFQSNGNNTVRPMSGVSHYVARPLPPTQNWSNFRNPQPNNYFRSRDVNFTECNDYTLDYEPYTDYYNEYYQDNYCDGYPTDDTYYDESANQPQYPEISYPNTAGEAYKKEEPTIQHEDFRRNPELGRQK